MSRLNLLLPSVFKSQFDQFGYCQLGSNHIKEKGQFSLKTKSVKVSENHLVIDLSISWRQRPDGTLLTYEQAIADEKNLIWGWNNFRINVRLPKAVFAAEELDKLVRMAEINSKPNADGTEKKFSDHLRLWGYLTTGGVLTFTPKADFCQYQPKDKKGEPMDPYYLLSGIDLRSVEWQGLGLAVEECSGVIQAQNISSLIDAAFAPVTSVNLPVPDSTTVPQTDGAVF